MDQTPSLSHSADVKIWLDCGVHGRIALGRVTRTSVEAKAVHNIPPCEAEVIVTVDGEDVRRRVNLVNGFADGRRVALVSPIDSIAPF